MLFDFPIECATGLFQQNLPQPVAASEPHATAGISNRQAVALGLDMPALASFMRLIRADFPNL